MPARRGEGKGREKKRREGRQRDSPVRIDSNAIAAEQCAIQVAIISAAIALVHGQQDEAALVCLDVFGGRVAHLVAAKEREREIAS